MNGRDLFSVFVWLATAGLLALRVGTGDSLARSFGFAFAPWLVGLIVALIKAAFKRRPGAPSFRDSVEGAALVVLLILYAITLCRPGA